MKQPYTPDLTPKALVQPSTEAQERLARYQEWELRGNYWTSTKTGQQLLFHPLAMEMGNLAFEAAEKLAGRKPTNRRK